MKKIALITASLALLASPVLAQEAKTVVHSIPPFQLAHEGE